MLNTVLKCGLLEGRAAGETASRLSTTAGFLQAVLLLKGIKVYCKFKGVYCRGKQIVKTECSGYTSLT